MTDIQGIHHVTAIASDPQRNVDFYAGMLGLRLVKRTVNFDDPQTYHLYYGDEVGTPGSIMTFFPWPGARRGRIGSGQVAVTSFSVLPSAIGFWVERLVRHGIKYQGPTKRGTGADSEQVIALTDPDGLMLEIVGHPGAESRPAWGGAPGIKQELAIHGFHAVTLWLDDASASERVLTDTLGFRPGREDGTTRRYAIGDGGPGTIVDLRAIGDFGRGAGGAGTVHHVAFRVPDDAAELAVRGRVTSAGLHPTPVIDRNYFHSVYFREPGGVLFELATNPPGFAIDEPVAHLGERLMLPPQYEPHRAEIEAVLPPIHLGVTEAAASLFANADGPEDVSGEALGFVHRYVPPNAGAELAGGTTLLLLHGTGGDEEDLIPVGRELLPGAGMLSPRGKVLERGAPRFFRRIAEGVFDQEDLARRTEELAAFVEAATATYQLERDGIVAVGFSNGANIAASLLLRRPGLLRGAVLFSPMVPFEPEALPQLEGTSVFIGAGRMDQMHSLAHPDDWDQAMGPGGALEALVEAKAQGLVRAIGVTGHGWSIPAMHRRSLARFDFDSILLPYNFFMMQNERYRDAFEEVAAICRERNVAVQTIKGIARGPWAAADRTHATWYQPLTRQEDIDRAVHWVLGRPGVFLNTAGDLGLLPMVLDAASRFARRPSDQEMTALHDSTRMSSLFGLPT